MNLQETFGSLVFNDAVMRQRLPKETYQMLHRTIVEGRTLNAEVADDVLKKIVEDEGYEVTGIE